MAIRGSSLAGAIIPVGGPAGNPGQSTYQAWLALGNTGSLADFMAAQKGAPGGVTTLAGLVGPLTLDDINALARNGDASNATVAPSKNAGLNTLARLLAGVVFQDGPISAASQLTTASWVRAFGAGYVNILGALSQEQLSDVLNNIGSIDLTATIQSYLNQVGAVTVLWPAGTYRIAGTITPAVAQNHIGVGRGWNGGTIIFVPGSPSAPTFALSGALSVEGFAFRGSQTAQAGHAFVNFTGNGGTAKGNFFFGGYAQIYMGNDAFYVQIDHNKFCGGAVIALWGVSTANPGFDFTARGNRFLSATADRTVSIVRLTGLGSGVWTDNIISVSTTAGPAFWIESVAPLFGGFQASNSVTEQGGAQPALYLQGTGASPINYFHSVNCIYTGTNGPGVLIGNTQKPKFIGGAISSKATSGAFAIQGYGNGEDIDLVAVEMQGDAGISPIQFQANSGGSINLIGVTWRGAAPLLDASAMGAGALHYINVFGGFPGTAAQPFKLPGSTPSLILLPGLVGFNGAAPVGKQTIPAAATDAASTMALANALRTALLSLGFAQ